MTYDMLSFVYDGVKFILYLKLFDILRTKHYGVRLMSSTQR